jgi:phosphoribosylformylglycinamidine synthase
MNRYRALILKSPGSRGERFFVQALKQCGLDPEVLDVQGVMDYRIDLDQLCLKYRVLVLPGGQSYCSILGGGKALAVKIEHAFRWDLSRFAERGGLVLGVGTGFQTLLHLKVFGDDFTLRVNPEAEMEERWIRAIPFGSRSVWLKGLGTLELPVNLMDTEFVIEPGALVEAKGKLDRLGMACLKSTDPERILGLCDLTGRILGMMPEPEYFLSWIHSEDWYLNPTRASAPGQGLSIFENAAKALE